MLGLIALLTGLARAIGVAAGIHVVAAGWFFARTLLRVLLLILSVLSTLLWAALGLIAIRGLAGILAAHRTSPGG
jgi:hypothetical protein